MTTSDRRFAASDALFARSQGLIPAHTQTLAKGPGQWVEGAAPKYLRRGKGAHVWDVDGNEYVDLMMGIGPLVLGYCDERVDEAIHAQLSDGITFSMMHPLEVEVAERVRDVVPNTESVRFSKTGCDVTTAAVRLARAFTGRNKVLCCGYHGWHDWYVSVTDRARGIPASTGELVHTFAFNDLQSVVDGLDDDTACVILEPRVFEAPAPGFLEGLRALCDARGVLLVFDEMWSGFRFALGGAQEKYGVRADLACFSKAIANGMPLSVLSGRADVMSLLAKDVFFFTTFGGEALSLAAAAATIDILRWTDALATIATQGRALRDGYNALARELDLGFTRCFGDDARSIVTFDAKAGDPLVLKSFVQQEMVARGVLWGGFHNVCAALTDDDVARTLDAYRSSLTLLRDALHKGDVRERLRGKPVEPVFRKTTNFHMKPVAGVAR